MTRNLGHGLMTRSVCLMFVANPIQSTELSCDANSSSATFLVGPIGPNSPPSNIQNYAAKEKER